MASKNETDLDKFISFLKWEMNFREEQRQRDAEREDQIAREEDDKEERDLQRQEKSDRKADKPRRKLVKALTNIAYASLPALVNSYLSASSREPQPSGGRRPSPTPSTDTQSPPEAAAYYERAEAHDEYVVPLFRSFIANIDEQDVVALVGMFSSRLTPLLPIVERVKKETDERTWSCEKDKEDTKTILAFVDTITLEEVRALVAQIGPRSMPFMEICLRHWREAEKRAEPPVSADESAALMESIRLVITSLLDQNRALHEEMKLHRDIYMQNLTVQREILDRMEGLGQAEPAKAEESKAPRYARK